MGVENVIEAVEHVESVLADDRISLFENVASEIHPPLGCEPTYMLFENNGAV